MTMQPNASITSSSGTAEVEVHLLDKEEDANKIALGRLAKAPEENQVFATLHEACAADVGDLIEVGGESYTVDEIFDLDVSMKHVPDLRVHLPKRGAPDHEGRPHAEFLRGLLLTKREV